MSIIKNTGVPILVGGLGFFIGTFLFWVQKIVNHALFGSADHLIITPTLGGIGFTILFLLLYTFTTLPLIKKQIKTKEESKQRLLEALSDLHECTIQLDFCIDLVTYNTELLHHVATHFDLSSFNKEPPQKHQYSIHWFPETQKTIDSLLKDYYEQYELYMKKSDQFEDLHWTLCNIEENFSIELSEVIKINEMDNILNPIIKTHQNKIESSNKLYQLLSGSSIFKEKNNISSENNQNIISKEFKN